MELLCPECLASLESGDGQTARCATHGGQFEILFLRSPLPAPPRDPNAPAFTLAAGAMCAQHASVPASCLCADCGTPMCGTCAFVEPDGSQLCHVCARRRATCGPPQSPAVPQMPADVRCVQHAHLPATAQCQTCGAFMCDTCKFEVPGGICICPACATTPRTELSPKRKKMLIGCYALAIWCTLATAALFAGVFKNTVRNEVDEQVLGVALLIFIVGPAIAGVSLGVGVMNRRSPNSIAVWLGIIWNAVILGGYVLLCIVGLMKGG
jgi:hypothetical protein